jgi:pyruvate formate lyase activating enzyme
MLKEAVLWKPLEEKAVNCYLCSHRCKIKPSRYGICGVRQNIDGCLYTHAYGMAIAANIDPIEKKPLYHVLPGSTSFSIATHGCNFKCGFCQNWQISQLSNKEDHPVRGYRLSPEDVVKKAKETGCKSISYTYTEPTIFFEYASETGKLARKEGLLNVFVTNGFMTHEALDKAAQFLDAANVDLKSFKDDFYKTICHGRLNPVLNSIRYMKKLGIWVEITTLVIPGANDSENELSAIAHFIAETDPYMPWHISRFHPDYHYTDKSPTPIFTLETALDIGRRQGLHHIYLGNVPGESNTVCPGCKATLIGRRGYAIGKHRLDNGRCSKCGVRLAGIFS